MHNCPQPGKWAISVWDGPDGSETGEALTTCGAGGVDFAYYLDRETNSWLGYFEGRPEVSKLLTLDNMQGVIAHGAMGAPPRTPTPEPTPSPQEAAMHNCPEAGKWAISVWDGADGSETSEALATCGEVTVDFAYYLDPETNGWLGYFEGQPEITKLLTLDNMQGIIAHGAMSGPPPTATPTPTITATPGTAGDVVLVSSNAFTTTTPFFLIDGESRRMHIVGELRNDSATARSAGKIRITIYDAANNVVGSRWNYACDNIIMPGRTTAFAVTYPSLFYSSDETNYFPEGWTRYEITLSPRDPYDWEDKPVDIAVENVQVSEGGLHVTGNAVNSSSKTVDTYDVKVYVIYYRADGAILNVGAEWAVNDQPLGPGQSTSFDIIFASDEPLDFSSYVVQAYAEAE
jgi:hypothetical protein